MAVNTRNSIVTNGLVLHLDAANTLSYQSGSTTWNDLSGNRNNGTLVNGPTFDSGNGGSIVFDGVNDYVDLSPYYYSNITQHTAIAVFNSSNINATWGEILQKGQRRDFTIRQYSNTGKLDFRYITNDITYGYINFVLQNNTWYTATMSINTELGGSFKCYINGVKVHETSITTPTTLFEDSTYVGQLAMGRILPGTEYFPGKIPISMMYERQLTDQEVLQNYNATKSRFNLL